MTLCFWQANKWRGRNFEGVLSLTHDNKVHYAEMHGYSYEDASWVVSGAATVALAWQDLQGICCVARAYSQHPMWQSTAPLPWANHISGSEAKTPTPKSGAADERPASWSKILAVKHYLKDRDWVMWLDADTIVTNPDIRLESLLPRSSNGPDFVITVDGGGYNAGIWLMRRSEWSMAFLDRWWSMKQYVRVRLLPARAQTELGAWHWCDTASDTSLDVRSRATQLLLQAKTGQIGCNCGVFSPYLPTIDLHMTAAARGHKERGQRRTQGAAGRGAGQGAPRRHRAAGVHDTPSDICFDRCCMLQPDPDTLGCRQRPRLSSESAAYNFCRKLTVGHPAPQCSFNSYVWRSRVRDWWRLVYMPNTILLGLYRPGVCLSCGMTGLHAAA